MRALAWSPDGKRIATTHGAGAPRGNGSIQVWDAASGKELAVLRGHRGGVYSAAFSPDGTRIVTADSEFGQMLFDSTGQAIYLFDIETTPKPTCYNACAEAWPPGLTTGDPVAGRGVERSLLATTKRSDGTVQVTYNDHPLYFYAHEGKREVKCHDIFLNGGNWYVVQPGGGPAPTG